MAAKKPFATSAVGTAVEFVAAQPGGVERILRQHYPREGGMCAGCVAVPTSYPCQAARIAELARAGNTL